MIKSEKQRIIDEYNKTWEEERKLNEKYKEELKAIREKRNEIYNQYKQLIA